ncbi:hypothetical protein, partial [Nocardia abscessus]|uniref:hypothetical protein n=1 Tax=Nocardia abscessus TaxID=120957 RepID=UPI002457438D
SCRRAAPRGARGPPGRAPPPPPPPRARRGAPPPPPPPPPPPGRERTMLGLASLETWSRGAPVALPR